SYQKYNTKSPTNRYTSKHQCAGHEGNRYNSTTAPRRPTSLQRQHHRSGDDPRRRESRPAGRAGAGIPSDTPGPHGADAGACPPDAGLRMTGFFRPELERALRVAAVLVLVGAIVVPVRWGYEQRQQARTWQQTACSYRLREVTRATNS